MTLRDKDLKNKDEYTKQIEELKSKNENLNEQLSKLKTENQEL